MSPQHSDPKAQRILAAARKVLARKGYAGTTIQMVAKEAGVSRGLLHYYFESKDAMLARVLTSNLEASLVFLDKIFQRSQNAQEMAANLTKLLRGMMAAEREFFDLLLEGFAVARQSETVKQELATVYGNFRAAVQAQLTQAAAQGRIAPQTPLAGLAVLITAVIDGFALQLVTEPELAQAESTWESLQVGLRDLLSSESFRR